MKGSSKKIDIFLGYTTFFPTFALHLKIISPRVGGGIQTKSNE